MKKTTICDPSDLISFAEKHHKIPHNDACDVMALVCPEYECKTLEYTLEEVQKRVQELRAEKASLLPHIHHQALEESLKSNEILLDFMNHHQLQEFTLTQ